MRLATLKIMRVINDKIYPRGKWMSFTNTTRQVVQFAFSAGRDSVAVLVWRGDRAVARISKSAVSRVSNPQTLRRLQSRGTGDGSADWKSAIQQVGNLRHFKGAFCGERISRSFRKRQTPTLIESAFLFREMRE